MKNTTFLICKLFHINYNIQIVPKTVQPLKIFNIFTENAKTSILFCKKKRYGLNPVPCNLLLNCFRRYPL